MQPPQPVQKEKTPEEKLRVKLRYSINQYRIAVRWLRDAGVYKKTYASELTYEGKPWKNDQESELGQDAVKAYKEAVASVLYWRRQIDECNKGLMDMAKEKINAGKQA